MEISYELLSLYGIKHFKKRKQERRCKYPTCYPGTLQKVASLKKETNNNKKTKYHPPKHPKQNPLLHADAP